MLVDGRSSGRVQQIDLRDPKNKQLLMFLAQGGDLVRKSSKGSSY